MRDSVYLYNLLSRRRAISDELEDLDFSRIGGKPNLSHSDGGTATDHIGYKKSLYFELEQIDKAILRYRDTQSAIDDGPNGPFEVATRVVS